MKIIRLIDRTRTVSDWKCPRLRYWNYEYQGRGISKSSTSLPLFMGITIHDSLAAIAMYVKDGSPVPIDNLADLASRQMVENLLSPFEGKHVPQDAREFAREQAALVEGLIRGFYLHLWPKLMLNASIVAIEQEMEYSLNEVVDDDGTEYVFMTKPDLVIEKEGELVYIEYKSTSSKKPEWVNSWDTAVQLHSSVKATEATLGRPVGSVQIVGLYKGYESYGKQSSPFCYAYKKLGNPPFTQDQTLYEYKAGFRRYATWELPGGVKAWVEGMPENVLANQFPLTAPIYVNDDLVNAFFRQRLAREIEIADSGGQHWPLEHTLDRVFPQHFDQCVPSFGWKCDYVKLCHGNVEDPLLEGFELRTPHHDQEVF